MDRALYVALSGASHTLRAQTANSHNLANASTHGFKAELEAMRSVGIEGGLLPTRVNAALADRGWDASAGPVQTTGRPLDVALKGNAWLAVQAPDGQTAYTRNGSLRVSPEGLLTTVGGLPVLGDGGPITVPPGASMAIGGDGTVSVLPTGEAAGGLAVVGRLRTAEAEPAQLDRRADGLMRARGGRELPPTSGYTLLSGALEGSNVNATEALINMIELARQFELQVKVMKTAEENERQAASISRLG